MSVAIDQYFPFDNGAGATANQARWRLMGRLFCGSGVIAGYLNQCTPTMAGGVISVDTGALWIDGFYGENDAPKTGIATGGDGMLVARMDPVVQEVMFVYVLAQTTPTQNPSGIWEVPLARVTSGVLYDIRHYASNIPAGVIWDYAGGTLPPGWLLCDGTQYLRGDYPALFSALSTNWNTGVDSTHFSVPDLRGRTTLGTGGGYLLTNRALYSYGGGESIALNNANLSSHTHGITDPGHGHDVHTEYINPSNINFGAPGTWSVMPSGAASSSGARVSGSFTGGTGVLAGTASAGAGLGANPSGVGYGFGWSINGNNGAVGTAGSPFSVMQPWAAVNKMIKT